MQQQQHNNNNLHSKIPLNNLKTTTLHRLPIDGAFEDSSEKRVTTC